MLVNWQTVNVRFTALMWMIAAVLAFVMFVSVLPSQANPRPSPRGWTTASAAHAGLEGRP